MLPESRVAFITPVPAVDWWMMDGAVFGCD
jgi:hypothetical protein